MSNKGWGITTEKIVRPLNVVLFVSRKKDNKKIGRFPRTQNGISYTRANR